MCSQNKTQNIDETNKNYTKFNIKFENDIKIKRI